MLFSPVSTEAKICFFPIFLDFLDTGQQKTYNTCQIMEIFEPVFTNIVHTDLFRIDNILRQKILLVFFQFLYIDSLQVVDLNSSEVFFLYVKTI